MRGPVNRELLMTAGTVLAHLVGGVLAAVSLLGQASCAGLTDVDTDKSQQLQVTIHGDGNTVLLAPKTQQTATVPVDALIDQTNDVSAEADVSAIPGGV